MFPSANFSLKSGSTVCNLCLFQIRCLCWGRVQLSSRRWSMWAASWSWWPAAEAVRSHVSGFSHCLRLKAPFFILLTSFVASVRSGFHAPRLGSIENCMKLTRMIVQGLQESKSPLLQLPHFEEEHLRFCISKKVAADRVCTRTRRFYQVCVRSAAVQVVSVVFVLFFSTKSGACRTWWASRTQTGAACCASWGRRSTMRSWLCWGAFLTSPWKLNYRVGPVIYVPSLWADWPASVSLDFFLYLCLQSLTMKTAIISQLGLLSL